MPTFQTTQGDEIYYEVHGETGPPLVFIHGLASCTRIWENQVPELSRRYRVFTWDFPGHGRSSWRRHYRVTDFVAVLEEFMNHRALESAHLVGLSVGCSVALTFAARFPNRVRSLVLLGPSGGIRSIDNPLAWHKYLAIALYLLTLYVSYRLMGQDRTVEWIVRYGPQTYGYYRLIHEVESEVDPQAIKEITWNNAYAPYIGQLHKVHAPALIIRGRGDRFPRRYYRYIQDHLPTPCPLFEIPATRHVASVEKPAIVNRVVLAFLEFLERHQRVET